jgi:hypothetical protein
MDMDSPNAEGRLGPFEARYLAFLETISQLRPRLHQYCSRMTGSVMDGEDVVQDALFEAYRKLDQYDDSRPLAPWLFRIALTFVGVCLVLAAITAFATWIPARRATKVEPMEALRHE